MKSTLTEFEIRELILKYQSELKKLNYQVDVLMRLISNLEDSIATKVSIKTKEAEIIDSVSKSIPVKAEAKKKDSDKRGKSAISMSGASISKAKKPIGKKKAESEASSIKIKASKIKSAKVAGKKAAIAKKDQKIKKTSVGDKAIKKAVKVALAAKTQEPKKKTGTIKSAQGGYKLSPWDKLVAESIAVAQKALTTYEIVDYVRSKAKENKLSDEESLVKNKVVRSLQKLANRRYDIAKAAYKGKGFVYALPPWVDAQGKLDKKYK